MLPVAGQTTATSTFGAEFRTAKFVYTFPVEWQGPGARLAVSVEELASGLWGGAVIGLGEPGVPGKQ